MDDEAHGMDAVFKALADPTRRLLLDRLREQNGQTLRELCEHLEMARQSATQHLNLLEAANLVTVVRRGRERLHYLNPTPIHEIQERWISGFDQPRLKVLSLIKNQAEEYAMTTAPTSLPTYVYVTYIRASAKQVWQALTDADLTAQYWGHRNVSDWQAGSTWEHRRLDGSGLDVVGKVLETEPPTRLVITFEGPDGDEPAGGPSVVTFLVEPHQDIVRLTVTHQNIIDPGMLAGISQGWPAVLANLKSLLETGAVLPQAPWETFPSTHEGEPAATTLAATVALFEHSADYALQALADIADADLTRPTPCSNWDLATLVRHLTDSADALIDLVSNGRFTLPAPSPQHNAEPKPVKVTQDRIHRLRDALRAAITDESSVGSSDRTQWAISAAQGGAIELAAHGWDINTARGTERPVPTEPAGEILTLATSLISDDGRAPQFGPAVAISPSASPSDRLVAFLGRRPPTRS